jgi:hypothetical protein
VPLATRGALTQHAPFSCAHPPPQKAKLRAEYIGFGGSEKQARTTSRHIILTPASIS